METLWMIGLVLSGGIAIFRVSMIRLGYKRMILSFQRIKKNQF